MKVSMSQEEYDYLESRLFYGGFYLLVAPLSLGFAQRFMFSVNMPDVLLTIGVLMGSGIWLLSFHDFIVDYKEEIV